MTSPGRPDRSDAATVLRLSLVAWGLGHLALGETALGFLFLAAEVIALATLAVLAVSLVDTTLQLVPFLAGLAFIAAWAWQAVAAYRQARARHARGHALDGIATDATPVRSPAATIAWLTLPLLIWSSGFWLLPGSAASPAAVLDRFVAEWTDGAVDAKGWPPAVAAAAEEATARLEELCAARRLRAGCEAGGTELFRDVRVRLAEASEASALGVAEAVRYERRETRFLGLFPGTELVPVAIERVLNLRLAAGSVIGRPIDVGAERWRVVSSPQS